MRITVIIGPTEAGSSRFRTILKKKSMLLEKHGVYCPDWNHIRVYMACADLDQVGVVRFKRGFESAASQKALFDETSMKLEKAFEDTRPDHLLFGNGQIGGMYTRPAEIERLRELLKPFSDDIRIVAHVAEQARVLTPHYANRVLEGRGNALDLELELTQADNWWDASLAMRGENEPLFGMFNDVQFPPPWVDYKSMLSKWEEAFGEGNVVLRPLETDTLNSEEGAEELNAILGTDIPLGKLSKQGSESLPSATSVARIRQFNDVLIRYMKAKDVHLPRDIWRILSTELRLPGDPVDPGSLSRVSDYFRADNAELIKRFPDLGNGAMDPAPPCEDWQEAETQNGFRATQYLAAFEYRIKKNEIPAEEKRAEKAEAAGTGARFDELLPDDPADAGETNGNGSKAKLLQMVEVNHQIVLSTKIRPHNDLGRLKEDEIREPFALMPERNLPVGSSGRVIVGCMKNEAPYILEWVAYHRAIGVDKFLIYTNGCEDGTDEILDRLQEMGVVEHRLNDDWRGNSPQQFALNRSLKEPVIRAAEWIIHIDVDEFINVRTGDGTLDDLFAAVPDATNIAMTWRLFGHNGVKRLADRFVIEQFDTCAPKFCPKPHTVWGFKSMFKNIGAYEKISCHRPNKLDEKFLDVVKWVNGSGRDITKDTAERGWRNSKSNIGYDLVQLNHYALRSAESFLIKRQRGRALHVDRSIGLNYWIRMDWSDFRDVTIKRNVPRLREEYDRLLADDELRSWHQKGLNWHRAKAEELHGTAEFEELYQRALKVKLNETERVAYALALDMES